MRGLRLREEVKQRVRQRIEQQYLTQQRLSDYSGISRCTINRYVNSTKVSLINFEEISRALGFENWKDLACPPDDPSDDPPELDIIPYQHPVAERCYQILTRPGALLRIKAPRRRGKTTLANEVLSKLSPQNYRIVNLSLDSVVKSNYENINSFLKWFCVAVGNELNIPNQLSQFWDQSSECIPTLNCSSYFRRFFLIEAADPLILRLDRLDQIFPHQEIARDFFGLLRSWHEQARDNRHWQQLRLVLLYCTEDYGDIDPIGSPFNVGREVTPPEFNAERVSILAEQYGLNWSTEQIQQLMNFVDGHPYLIDEMLTHFEDCHRPLDQQLKLESDPTCNEIYSGYLRLLWKAIHGNRNLIRALGSILDSSTPILINSIDTNDSIYTVSHRLIDIGLITRVNDNQVQPYCRLFRDYFRAEIDRFYQDQS
jgi:transcriptional regulator with XRE-family HTH domain